MINPPSIATVGEWLTIVNTVLLSLLGTGTVVYNRILDLKLQSEQKRRTAEHEVLTQKVDSVVNAVNGPLTAALGVASTTARALALAQPTPENISAAKEADTLRDAHAVTLQATSAVAPEEQVK